MNKVLLVYWPENGNVEKVAGLLGQKLNEFTLIKRSIVDVSKADMNEAAYWIIGGSTVGSHVWEDADDSNKWFDFFRKLDDINLTEKTVAFYGLGDQILYPHHFVDGLGVLQEEFEKRNANIVGHWPTDGYKFSDSEGFKDDKFFGLPLNEDHEPELTDERINNWLDLIRKDFISR
jgi:flavodoxin I